MSLNPNTWNEQQLSEIPAVGVLARLGWTEHQADDLEAERTSRKDVFLRPRLARAIKKLNPWISDTNV